MTYTFDVGHLPYDRILELQEFIEESHEGLWSFRDGASCIDGVYEEHCQLVLHDADAFTAVTLKLMI